MAVSRGRALLNQSNPDPDEIKKSIAALEVEVAYLQKTMNAGVRDYISGNSSISEINGIIQQLREKL